MVAYSGKINLRCHAAVISGFVCCIFELGIIRARRAVSRSIRGIHRENQGFSTDTMNAPVCRSPHHAGGFARPGEWFIRSPIIVNARLSWYIVLCNITVGSTDR
jgi:hypothetical protein